MVSYAIIYFSKSEDFVRSVSTFTTEMCNSFSLIFLILTFIIECYNVFLLCRSKLLLINIVIVLIVKVREGKYMNLNRIWVNI